MLKQIDLLTEDAKITRIKSLLPKTDRRGRFFLPDNSFYLSPLDDNGLQIMLKTLSLWAGFKPVGLQIGFSRDIDTDSDFTLHQGKPTILISSRFRTNPFAAGALVAEGLMRYFLEYRKQLILSDPTEQARLTELAVVYSGLGLVAVNKSTSYWQQRYPAIYKRLFNGRPGKAGSNYPEFARRFARDYGLQLGALCRYLCPWALIGLGLKTSAAPTDYAKTTSQLVTRSNTALIASCLVIVSGLGIGGYIISQRPAQLPLALRQEKETIDILKNSHELCLKSVTNKQLAYDDETDFFIERNINADRLRCTSIQNLYNSRVERFNSQL